MRYDIIGALYHPIRVRHVRTAEDEHKPESRGYSLTLPRLPIKNRSIVLRFVSRIQWTAVPVMVTRAWNAMKGGRLLASSDIHANTKQEIAVKT